MFASRATSNDHPLIIPEILQQKVADIQLLLTQKDMEKLKSALIADLKEPIKKMCNQASNPSKKISDVEEVLNEVTFLELYIDIINGLLTAQTTSKTLLAEMIACLANDFNIAMHSGHGHQKKKNHGSYKNPFNFLNLILQNQEPIKTLQKALEDIREYSVIAKKNIMTGKPSPRFEFPIVKSSQKTHSNDEYSNSESKETTPKKIDINYMASIIETLKEPFYKILSLKGDAVFLDKAIRLADLVTSHYMFISYNIPLHKIAIVIANTLLSRMTKSDENERVEDLKTLLEFLKVLSYSNENIISAMLRNKPVLLTRVQQSIQTNLDTQTLADFNNCFKTYIASNERKSISLPISKNIGKELTGATIRIESTQTTVLKALEEAISNDDLDEAIIDGGQVDDAIDGIEGPESIRYEAEVLSNPDLFEYSPKDQETITESARVVEPVKICVR